MKSLLLVIFLCSSGVAAESKAEAALRAQLASVQASLDRANAEVARLAASAKLGNKEIKKTVSDVSDEVTRTATDASISRAANAEEARWMANDARSTASAAKAAAKAVADNNRALISSLIVGMLFTFFLILGALGFIVVDVKSKASADRQTFLTASAHWNQAVLALLGETKAEMKDLKAHTNSRLSELLAAKDEFREMSNKAEYAKGTLAGHAAEKAEKIEEEKRG